MRMGEHFEPVLPGDSHQRHAASLSHAERKRGRRRYRDDDWRADDGRFLHHLNRDAAGQHHDAFGSVGAFARERTGELVQSIVTANVLAHGNEAVGGIEEASAMHRAGLAVQRLQGEQRLDRRHDLSRRDAKTFVHARRRAHRLGQALDAAQPAPRWTRHLAPARQKLGGVRCFEPDAQLDADLLLDALHALDGVDGGDHSFGQAEADGEVLEILRGRHHHRIGGGVVREGDRGLLGDGAFACRIAARAPDRAGDADHGLGQMLTPLGFIAVETSRSRACLQEVRPASRLCDVRISARRLRTG